MADDFSAYDAGTFRRYTSCQELDKALHTLAGILKGIAIAGGVPSRFRPRL